MAKTYAFAAPVAWTNQKLVLYHGTNDLKWSNPVEDLIRVASGRSRTDFGTGFYTTTGLSQARSWAWSATRGRPSANPIVIEFTIDREDLATLESVCFVRADSSAEDYWSLVSHCRLGNDHARAKNWYDVSIGPLASTWQNRMIFANTDQISFHTNAAELVLNAALRRSV